MHFLTHYFLTSREWWLAYSLTPSSPCSRWTCHWILWGWHWTSSLHRTHPAVSSIPGHSRSCGRRGRFQLYAALSSTRTPCRLSPAVLPAMHKDRLAWPDCRRRKFGQSRTTHPTL